MSRIPEYTIHEIRQRCDIIELIGSYISLKKKGNSYHALCPFHTEKTPSFVVSPAKQIYHCFGCGAGGDVFGFIVKQHNISYYEAIKILADRSGVNLPTKAQSKQELKKLEEKEQLYKINELAVKFYKNNLQSEKGKSVREYLIKRSVSKVCVDTFNLGYAPDGWNTLLAYMVNKGISQAQLLQAGLIIQRNNGGGYYDRFRSRLIFPIYNIKGKVIGFGGRCLEDSKLPKYLNSPDTIIYHKGHEFYGMNLARNEVIKQGTAIIVEGYFDLISAHQYGFTNVVATLGTALTQRQVRQLRQWAKTVIIFFDSDSAGISAAMRSWNTFLDSNLRVKVASLDTGGDPDSYLKEHGADAFLNCIKQADNLIDFVIKQSLKQAKLDTVDGKIECLNKILPTLASIKNQIERTSYLNKLSARLQIGEGLLLQELRKVVQLGKRRLEKTKPLSQKPIGQAVELAEKMLCILILSQPEVHKLVFDKLDSDDFSSSVYACIFQALKKIKQAGKKIEPTEIISQLQDEDARAFVCSASIQDEGYDDFNKIAIDCINAINKNKLKAKLKKLYQRFISEGDQQALKEYDTLAKMMKPENLPVVA